MAALLLIQDVAADDFVIDNGGKQMALYIDTVVVDEPRRVVVERLNVRDVVEVIQIYPDP